MAFFQDTMETMSTSRASWSEVEEAETPALRFAASVELGEEAAAAATIMVGCGIAAPAIGAVAEALGVEDAGHFAIQQLVPGVDKPVASQHAAGVRFSRDHGIALVSLDPRPLPPAAAVALAAAVRAAFPEAHVLLCLSSAPAASLHSHTPHDAPTEPVLRSLATDEMPDPLRPRLPPALEPPSVMDGLPAALLTSAIAASQPAACVCAFVPTGSDFPAASALATVAWDLARPHDAADAATAPPASMVGAVTRHLRKHRAGSALGSSAVFL
mmetsp:Transcript_28708/g.93279  ORF Transcript_28708/g.93279 Transcript_28708/m.93279 type:complete len:271 (-) Transcript_28708:725-1537(-)